MKVSTIFFKRWHLSFLERKNQRDIERRLVIFTRERRRKRLSCCFKRIRLYSKYKKSSLGCTLQTKSDPSKFKSSDAIADNATKTQRDVITKEGRNKSKRVCSKPSSRSQSNLTYAKELVAWDLQKKQRQIERNRKRECIRLQKQERISREKEMKETVEFEMICEEKRRKVEEQRRKDETKRLVREKAKQSLLKANLFCESKCKLSYGLKPWVIYLNKTRINEEKVNFTSNSFRICAHWNEKFSIN